MKSIGIVRRLDELGRIVLPKELRRNLNINTTDGLEIFVDGNTVVLKKYEPSCIFCGEVKKDLIVTNGKRVCKECAKKLAEEADK
jgi:AbrB family transcriptional regulator, transcriptional pleiotropic regulator of transition state genes